ncbi:hypothetical protein D3C87_1988470 [compost metagenome]
MPRKFESDKAELSGFPAFSPSFRRVFCRSRPPSNPSHQRQGQKIDADGDNPDQPGPFVANRCVDRAEKQRTENRGQTDNAGKHPLELTLTVRINLLGGQ